MKRVAVAVAVVLSAGSCKKSTGDLEVDKYLGIFEAEDREVFKHRQKIVAAMMLAPDMAVADVGAGTGAFLQPLADAVGPGGTVYAVDIADNFVAHMTKRIDELGLKQVRPIHSTTVSVSLPEASIDKALICATYHHFDDHRAMMRSIHRALKPGGEVYVVDFIREDGLTKDQWVLDHVRAGAKTFASEIIAAGFVPFPTPATPFLKKNYMIGFRRGDE